MDGLLLALLLACGSSPQLPPGPTTEHWFEAPVPVTMRFPAEGRLAQTPNGVVLSLPDRRWGEPSLSLVAGDTGGDFAHRRKLANGATLRYSQEETVEERVSTSVLQGALELDGHRFAVECRDYREAEEGADALRWCEPWLGTLRRVEPKP